MHEHLREKKLRENFPIYGILCTCILVESTILPVTSLQAVEEKLCTAENVVALLNRSFRSARSPVSQ